MKAGGLWHIFYRLAAYNSLGFTVCRLRAPHIASAIHLIWDPLAQHREEPLVRRRKELAVIWSATQVVAAAAKVSPAPPPLEQAQTEAAVYKAALEVLGVNTEEVAADAQ